MNIKKIASWSRAAVNGLLATGMALAFFAIGSTHEAPPLWPSTSPANQAAVDLMRERQQVNSYEWTREDEGNYPNCREADGSPELGDSMLVVDAWSHGAGERVVASFDRVAEMAQENDRDKFVGMRWTVIGYCS